MKKPVKASKKAYKVGNKNLKKTDKTIEIYGVALSSTPMSQVLSKLWLQRREMLHIATVNPEYLMEARSNARFRDILAQCLCVADGHGVVWASRILGTSQLERISGTALVERIVEHAALRGEKVFLLGAQSGVAEKAAAAMKDKYPGAQIDWYEGAKQVVVEKREEASMTIAKINSVSPDYLLVAYGSPWQDLWIEENRPYLRVKVAMGIGGVLDEWAGVVTACPVWIDRLGMKWVWRVLHEPWRWKRIGRALLFGWLVVWQKLRTMVK